MESTIYITTSGTKYHNSNCSMLKSSKIPKMLSELSEKYTPCSWCFPKENTEIKNKKVIAHEKIIRKQSFNIQNNNPINVASSNLVKNVDSTIKKEKQKFKIKNVKEEAPVLSDLFKDFIQVKFNFPNSKNYTIINENKIINIDKLNDTYDWLISKEENKEYIIGAKTNSNFYYAIRSNSNHVRIGFCMDLIISGKIIESAFYSIQPKTTSKGKVFYVVFDSENRVITCLDNKKTQRSLSIELKDFEYNLRPCICIIKGGEKLSILTI